ncbi:SusD-like starch-binding protein associating with outer membrane [Mucilaginibacter frigoritolerans]|uniref:SusD-like starch-binding protein associating with outer membrane n=1 Tax=Mucilaginibacter frigoritolerans TaxID=652788 RepID=A0A562TNC3_9SPHI|nr:RagB/SusD family nutrient uptake outer membrane protein [Mucilaginibacter frigoritolerans]TWI95037.1 SusD-like starch-binding protein associating with outer membrane [Mucilaginibacter frigoritolerans]
MKKYKFQIIIVMLAGIVLSSSCKKELNIQNPNSPTLAQASTETGLVSLAAGSIYVNGFMNGNYWLGNSFFSLEYGFDELLADDVASPDANQNVNVVNLPASVIFTDGTPTVNVNPTSQSANLRVNNTRATQSQNMFYYEWNSMYQLNNAANQILALAGTVPLSGDAANKQATLRAWAYWWKGYAYARIGSIYYSGIINNEISATNSNYVLSSAIIAESNKNLAAASAQLSSISNTTTYTTLMAQLLPSFVQTGHGGVPTPAAFIDNINTLEARNLLANTRTSAMTAADWQTIITLTTAGIQSSDNVFTLRTTSLNGLASATSGCVALNTSGPPQNSIFQIQERLIQDFKSGDQRFAKNFTADTTINQVGGYTFSSRWELLNAALTPRPAINSIQYADNTPGNQEIYIAGSYEENALMLAEAYINTGQVEQGLALVDAVRVYQQAGLASVAGTGLTTAQALEELRKERRIALLFRGTAFYDARRWGVIYDVSKGGGRTGCVVLTPDGVLHTNVTINYNFMDYWDVPADEFVLNPPASGSAPIKNPNY